MTAETLRWMADCWEQENTPPYGAALRAWADEIGARGERVTPEPAGVDTELLAAFDQLLGSFYRGRPLHYGDHVEYRANMREDALPALDFLSQQRHETLRAGSPVPADPENQETT